MYMSPTETENAEFVGGPVEPFNHDAAWGVKWVIEDQIKGAPDLLHPSLSGLTKYANRFLHQMATDPTATP